jgi:hypothetical protein
VPASEKQKIAPRELHDADALAEASGAGVAELTGTLLGLEMRELIRQLPGKCFVRKL